MLDGKRLVLKIDGLPFETHNFAAPKAVESIQQDGQFNRIALYRFKQIIDFPIL
ncbi:hypothetical protein ABEV00_13825 [Paenibacillus thiaminolyticus]|uniref:hypothetical protein n=1 Tax=Paenibacillus thiaminolyticus TaxID=49283 RepID=UPI003D2D9805